MNERTVCCVKQQNKINDKPVLVGIILSVCWCTWDSTLKDTKLTDVVCRGSIHPPPFLFFFHSSRDVRSPWHFFFLLSPEIHKQRPCNLFLPKLLSTICFRAGHVLSGRGRILRKKAGGKKDMLDGLYTALPGNGDTFNKSWRSVLVDNNRST